MENGKWRHNDAIPRQESWNSKIMIQKYLLRYFSANKALLGKIQGVTVACQPSLKLKA